MTDSFDHKGSITVLELNKRLSDAIAMAPGVRNVWVVGETSDVRLSAGHCYMELVEKGEDGSNKSRIRAIIWANAYRQLSERFRAFTGVAFGSGIKVRALVTASYHPAYGMSVTINDIDPSYTVGDAMRRRAEIIERLTAEGIIERNKQLAWALVPNRVAVISAAGAAGYGDFVTHLFTDARCLRFNVTLFPATMQGERTVPSVLEALERIGESQDSFDVVVIIRGGGATSDLAAFDDYSLAAAIAKFPLPVIIGIGHERDTTVLDYVASMRVKTPTAAAASLIERVARVLDALGRAADKIYQSAAQRISANRELLAHASAALPGLVNGAFLRCRSQLERDAMGITTSVGAAVSRNNERLARIGAEIGTAAMRTIERNAERLASDEKLLKVLSPDAVLSRGFSLTMLPGGEVLRNPSQVKPGTILTTLLSEGEIISVTK